MKTVILLAAGVLAACPLAALAQPQTQMPGPPQGVEVTGRAPQPYPLVFIGPEEIRRLHGVYDMDNGMQVPIDVRGRVLYVNLDGQVTALRAVARNVFVSRDRRMALAVADLDLPTVAISYLVAGRTAVAVAGARAPSTTLAQK